MSILESDQRFYTSADVSELQFYQLPKVFFSHPRYKTPLSPGAKILYSIMRDRMDLSIVNEWIDEKGRVYSIYPIDSKTAEESQTGKAIIGLSEISGFDRTSVMKYKKELAEAGLIIDRRRGQGKANWIYVLRPDLSPLTGSEAVEIVDKQKSKKPTSSGQVQKSKKSASEVIHEKSKIPTSESREFRPQEVENSDGNYTDFRETDFRETEKREEEDYKAAREPRISQSSESKTEKDRDPKTTNREETLRTYPAYFQIVLETQLSGVRDVHPNELLFLDMCSRIPVDPPLAFEIFRAMKNEILLSYVEHIKAVMLKFGIALRNRSIKVDPIDWYKTTWKRERLLIQQDDALGFAGH